MLTNMATGLQKQLTWRVTLSSDGGVHAVRDDGRAELLQEVRLSEYTLETRLRALLPARSNDLLRVALAVYVADRSCRRPTRKDDPSYARWQRRLNLRVPVSEPDFWSQAHITDSLGNTLAYYTGDVWDLEFTPLGKERVQAVQAELFGPNFSPTRAALFSGGLDSVAGACVEALDNPAERLLLIGATTGPRLRALQHDVASGLRSRLGSQIEAVLLDLGFQNRRDRAERQDEVTQRSRGFVFSVIGAVTSALAGLDGLVIYENGVGAINLPHTHAQVGVHLTRATNPAALERLGDLVSAVIERSFRFELPFLFDTKACMCARLPSRAFGELLGSTISCDGFPQRVAAHPQCGLCTSCLLRRLSLHASGLSHFDRRNYRVDVTAPGWNAPTGKQFPLLAMDFQVERLRIALGGEKPWSALVREWPELTSIALGARGLGNDAASTKEKIVAMYRQYCLEWDNFPVQMPFSNQRKAA